MLPEIDELATVVVCEDDEPTREPLCSCWTSGPPELPVIVLSGRASEADKLRGFGADADDYLVKPFQLIVRERERGAIAGAERPRTLPDKIVRRIAREREAGGTLRGIADGLMADGVPTAHGG